jgi:hypothetical protein
MISNKKDFENIIDSLLKPHGFKKKGDTWYLETEDCICFFSFGKSDLGKLEHVMGSFLKEMMNEKTSYPKYYNSHLKYSLNFFDDLNVDKTIFRIENKAYDEVREERLKFLMDNYAIPFLKDVSTKGGIKKAINKYPKLKYWMFVPIKKALGIPVEF